MADTKVSALTAIDAVASGDKIPVADASDLTASKSATAQQLKDFIAPLTVQEADRATDLTLTTSFADAVSLSLAAGTWLVIGQASVESTSTTQGNISVRLRNTTDAVTLALAEAEVDSALPDRHSLFVHAVVVLAATKTIALQGLQSAGTSHMIGPGNLGSDTAAKVTRMTAIKLA